MEPARKRLLPLSHGFIQPCPKLEDDSKVPEGRVRVRTHAGGFLYPTVETFIRLQEQEIERLLELIEKLKQEKRRAEDLKNKAEFDKVYFETNWEAERKENEKLNENNNELFGKLLDLQKKLKELENPQKE